MMLQDIGGRLHALGLVGATTGWPLSYGIMPESPDQVVVLTPYNGAAPARKQGLLMPGLQVMVRGKAWDFPAPYERIDRIALALDGMNPVGEVLTVLSEQSGPFFLGYDAQDTRPQFTWNFTVWRAVAAA